VLEEAVTRKISKLGQIYFSEITALDEYRLSIMTALKNMVGKTGHDHPSLSGRLRK